MRKNAEIRQVGGAAKTETQNFHLSVKEGHGNKRNAKEFEWALNRVQRHAWHGAERRLVIEDVSEDAADDLKGFLVAVNRKRGTLPDIEWANIIKPKNVVGVAVREEDCVEAVEG